MKLLSLLCTFASAAVLAAPADDYRALTKDVDALRMGGTSGGVALQGRLAFPVGISTNHDVVAAAGYHGDAETGGRVIAFAHTSFLEGENLASSFARNAVRWAGRKEGAKVLVVGNSARPWSGAGFDARSGDLTAESLKDCDVAVINLHRNPFKAGPDVLDAFAAKGGGVIILTTPWAAGAEQLEAANTFLASAGLGFLSSGASETEYPVSKEPPSPNWSALNAVEALLADKTSAMEKEEKQRCAASLSNVLAAGKPAPRVLAGLEELNRARGWIRFAKSPALRKANNPVEAMLARYQAHLLETLPPDKVPAHPSAADFPGAVGEGPAVTKTIIFDATTGPDKLINHGKKTIINTGLYARPGEPITVTIPAAAAGAGLKVEIGIHIDRNWHLAAWRRAPQITRNEVLKEPVTKVANAFGGLVTILVPENCKVGKTQATIAGAVEAPVFTLGKTTEAEWNSRIKNAPGAWGFIETSKWTGYIPRDILQRVENPRAVAEYWQKVVDTADEYMGYAKWRRRGEAMLTDRDIVAGYGHAGYPVMMAYAHEDEGSRALVERGPQRGDWGFLHELGHTFQDSFDSNFTIATHAEVDVNLVPGIAMMLIHNRTAWDNNSHGTFDAKNRVKDMAAWEALPEAERTWDKACKTGSVAYDFYFTMAECFGWELYKKALGRMMNSLQQPGTDAELDALDPKSRNFKRNRFFLCFSAAAGRNLLPHFERYGLGKGEFGLSADVVAKVKSLPAWSGNQPITALEGPSTVAVKAGQQTGMPIAQFKATDPDAGTRFTFRITAGNEAGNFEVDQRSGALKLAKAVGTGSYPLTIEVTDSTIPVSTKSARCDVVVQ